MITEKLICEYCNSDKSLIKNQLTKFKINPITNTAPNI